MFKEGFSGGRGWSGTLVKDVRRPRRILDLILKVMKSPIKFVR